MVKLILLLLLAIHQSVAGVKQKAWYDCSWKGNRRCSDDISCHDNNNKNVGGCAPTQNMCTINGVTQTKEIQCGTAGSQLQIKGRCPENYAYAYSNGERCCNYGRTNHGEGITIQSTSCHMDAWQGCKNSPCGDYVDPGEKQKAWYDCSWKGNRRCSDDISCHDNNNKNVGGCAPTQNMCTINGITQTKEIQCGTGKKTLLNTAEVIGIWVGNIALLLIIVIIISACCFKWTNDKKQRIGDSVLQVEEGEKGTTGVHNPTYEASNVKKEDDIKYEIPLDSIENPHYGAKPIKQDFSPAESATNGYNAQVAAYHKEAANEASASGGGSKVAAYHKAAVGDEGTDKEFPTPPP